MCGLVSSSLEVGLKSDIKLKMMLFVPLRKKCLTWLLSKFCEEDKVRWGLGSDFTLFSHQFLRHF
jgi:hypothetical protein